MQLGFVIDHTRCIGCHACTVACKSENDVPLGDFRTWVKYVESGEFPDVRRDFAVLRCNQCSDAPCVTICPVSALDKGANGIVDVDPDACIGCKACMHGCPYDALYLNEAKGTAEKCHFCAHRVEQDLAPACAVVCPTEAIIPGDFDDPDSLVARMRREERLGVRKPEAGTRPNVYYREVAAAGIDPGATNLSHGSIWAQNPSGPRVDAEVFRAMEQRAAGERSARTAYDVPRKQLWGWKITGYLFAKSIAAGAFPAAFLAFLTAGGVRAGAQALAGWPALLSMLALSVTGVLLIADLKRPERFWYILVRPNWKSWLARGTYMIVGYSACLTLWLARGLVDVGGSPVDWLLGVPTLVLGGLTAAYTGWLFAQAKGRVLWMKRGFWLHLVVQGLLAGSACLALTAGFLDWDPAVVERLHQVLIGSLLAQLGFLLAEGRLAPKDREAEYHRAARLLSHGPYRLLHLGVGVGLGVALPLALLLFGAPAALAGGLALVGLWVTEDVFVRAGQALPIS